MASTDGALDRRSRVESVPRQVHRALVLERVSSGGNLAPRTRRGPAFHATKGPPLSTSSARPNGHRDRLYVDALALPLESQGGEYHHSERIAGCKSFGIWPLAQAAEVCFGTAQWPAERLVPQVSIEFDVADAAAVGPAALELEQAGYGCCTHRARSRGVRRWPGCSHRRARRSGSRTPLCCTTKTHRRRDNQVPSVCRPPGCLVGETRYRFASTAVVQSRGSGAL